MRRKLTVLLLTTLMVFSINPNVVKAARAPKTTTTTSSESTSASTTTSGSALAGNNVTTSTNTTASSGAMATTQTATTQSTVAQSTVAQAATTSGIIFDGIGFRFVNSDGSFAKNCRRSVNGTAFHFNALGYADRTGFDACKGNWKNTKRGKRYYFDDGRTPTGTWLLSDGKYYTFDDGYVVKEGASSSATNTSKNSAAKTSASEEGRTSASGNSSNSSAKTSSNNSSNSANSSNSSSSSNSANSANSSRNSSSSNSSNENRTTGVVNESLPVNSTASYGSVPNGYYYVKAVVLNEIVENKDGSGYKEWTISLSPYKENADGAITAYVTGLDKNNRETNEQQHIALENVKSNAVTKKTFQTGLDVEGFAFE